MLDTNKTITINEAMLQLKTSYKGEIKYNITFSK